MILFNDDITPDLLNKLRGRVRGSFNGSRQPIRKRAHSTCTCTPHEPKSESSSSSFPIFQHLYRDRNSSDGEPPCGRDSCIRTSKPSSLPAHTPPADLSRQLLVDHRSVPHLSSPPTSAASVFAHRRLLSDSAVKKVEDVMPIATGHEREELEADLESREILDINFPVGPFGTKEAPAVVKSCYDRSVVGCPGGEGEDEHDVVWFWLKKDIPHEYPVCSQYLALEVVGPVGHHLTGMETTSIITDSKFDFLCGE